MPVANQLLGASIFMVTLPTISYFHTLVHLYAPLLVLFFVAIRADRARVRIQDCRQRFLLFIPLFASFQLFTFPTFFLYLRDYAGHSPFRPLSVCAAVSLCRTGVELTCRFVELLDLESVFDDVCGCFQSIDLLHRGLQAAGGCPVLRICAGRIASRCAGEARSACVLRSRCRRLGLRRVRRHRAGRCRGELLRVARLRRVIRVLCSGRRA